MKRLLVYRPAAQRTLARMDPTEAQRIIRALEVFITIGHGDIKALKGPLKGRYRLRVGKWRVFFVLELPDNVVVINTSSARIMRWASVGSMLASVRCAAGL